MASASGLTEGHGVAALPRELTLRDVVLFFVTAGTNLQWVAAAAAAAAAAFRSTTNCVSASPCGTEQSLASSAAFARAASGRERGVFPFWTAAARIRSVVGRLK